LKGWKALTLAQQKAGLAKLFSKLLLYKDRLEIHYAAGGSVDVDIIKDRNNAWVFDMKPAKHVSSYKFSNIPLNV